MPFSKGIVPDFNSQTVQDLLRFVGGAEGGFPYSHITLSQNVNILVKTKNAPKALKRKINLNIFL